MSPGNGPTAGFSSAEERLIRARVDSLVSASNLGTLTEDLINASRTGDQRLDEEIGSRAARRIVDEVRAQIRAANPADRAAVREMLRKNPPPGIEITKQDD